MSEAISIRVADLGDKQAVTDLLMACYPTLMREGYEQDVFEASLPGMTKANPVLLNSGTFFVAVINDDTVVGCGGWTEEEPGTTNKVEKLGHIRHFAVHPDWNGQSVGRSLYQACQTSATAQGIAEFQCYSSLGAEDFYEALGFSSRGVIEVPMAGGVMLPVVLMHRNL